MAGKMTGGRVYQSFYEVLGVDVSASEEEIRQSYKRRAMELHPDKCSLPDATSKFQELSNAYSVLRDPEKRHIYDANPEACREMFKNDEFGEDDHEIFNDEDFRFLFEYIFNYKCGTYMADEMDDDFCFPHDEGCPHHFHHHHHHHHYHHCHEDQAGHVHPHYENAYQGPSAKEQRRQGAPPDKLPKPITTVLGDGSVKVEWAKKEPRKAVDCYVLQCKGPGLEEFTTLYSGLTKNFIFKEGIAHQKYHFRVRAANDKGDGAWSDVSSVNMPANATGGKGKEGKGKRGDDGHNGSQSLSSDQARRKKAMDEMALTIIEQLNPYLSGEVAFSGKEVEALQGELGSALSSSLMSEAVKVEVRRTMSKVSTAMTSHTKKQKKKARERCKKALKKEMEEGTLESLSEALNQAEANGLTGEVYEESLEYCKKLKRAESVSMELVDTLAKRNLRKMEELLKEVSKKSLPVKEAPKYEEFLRQEKEKVEKEKLEKERVAKEKVAKESAAKEKAAKEKAAKEKAANEVAKKESESKNANCTTKTKTTAKSVAAPAAKQPEKMNAEVNSGKKVEIEKDENESKKQQEEGEEPVKAGAGKSSRARRRKKKAAAAGEDVSPDCPFCGLTFPAALINQHANVCLDKTTKATQEEEKQVHPKIENVVVQQKPKEPTISKAILSTGPSLKQSHQSGPGTGHHVTAFSKPSEGVGHTPSIQAGASASKSSSVASTRNPSIIANGIQGGEQGTNKQNGISHGPRYILPTPTSHPSQQYPAFPSNGSRRPGYHQPQATNHAATVKRQLPPRAGDEQDAENGRDDVLRALRGENDATSGNFYSHPSRGYQPQSQAHSQTLQSISQGQSTWESGRGSARPQNHWDGKGIATKESDISEPVSSLASDVAFPPLAVATSSKAKGEERTKAFSPQLQVSTSSSPATVASPSTSISSASSPSSSFSSASSSSTVAAPAISSSRNLGIVSSSSAAANSGLPSSSLWSSPILTAGAIGEPESDRRSDIGLGHGHYRANGGHSGSERYYDPLTGLGLPLESAFAVPPSASVPTHTNSHAHSLPSSNSTGSNHHRPPPGFRTPISPFGLQSGGMWGRSPAPPADINSPTSSQATGYPGWSTSSTPSSSRQGATMPMWSGGLGKEHHNGAGEEWSSGRSGADIWAGKAALPRVPDGGALGSTTWGVSKEERSGLPSFFGMGSWTEGENRWGQLGDSEEAGSEGQDV